MKALHPGCHLGNHHTKDALGLPRSHSQPWHLLRSSGCANLAVSIIGGPLKGIGAHLKVLFGCLHKWRVLSFVCVLVMRALLFGVCLGPLVLFRNPHTSNSILLLGPSAHAGLAESFGPHLVAFGAEVRVASRISH